ncbi:glycine betaine ABC transporter substrate-binding protein OsmF [Labrys sp. 22185]|uniref:glycine betaine ABC transporter substrate-binding protein OsmF n=1 Tax=Labrys sp. 22185 TaxID=3453888 RepID=UPI003F879CC1
MKAIARLMILALALSMAAPSMAAEPIRIGSKTDTEGSLLGYVILLMLEKGGLPTESRIPLGSSKLVRSALLTGAIDIYPEYTGNTAFFFNQDSDPVWKSADAAYLRARDLDATNKLVWLQPAPANNTWAIAVRADVAKEQNLATLDDFGRWIAGGGKMKIAASSEFTESAGALPAFEKAYGFKINSDQVLVLSGGDTAATEQAAASGTSGVNAAMAYGTDGQLAALGLVVMRDTKNVQLVFEPAPLIRKEVLDAHPEITGLLAPVFKSLTLETLQQLNARIAVDGEDARSVAKSYLTEKGFLQ